MEKDAIRFQFRLPSDLHEKLKYNAIKAGRSLNSELVYRLSQSLNEGGMKVALPLCDNPSTPTYFDPLALQNLVAHLQQTEISLANKSDNEISALLLEKISTIFTNSYVGGLECLWRGAYAQAFVARGRGERIDQPALYIQFFTVCESNVGTSYIELEKD